jgi:hypothetical protein
MKPKAPRDTSIYNKLEYSISLTKDKYTSPRVWIGAKVYVYKHGHDVSILSLSKATGVSRGYLTKRYEEHKRMLEETEWRIIK